MSDFKFSSDLFLEKVELNRFKKFLDEKGFRDFLLKNTLEYGLLDKQFFSIVNNVVTINNQYDNAKITVVSPSIITINEILAINKSGNLIYRKQDNLEIPTDDSWYWLAVKHVYTNKEAPIYAIDASGNLTCPLGNGNLLEILRGQPNFASRIKFPDTGSNVSEYDIIDVIDNNNATVEGNFVPEADQTIVVVGTFSPDAVPSAAEKNPFQYDSCSINIYLESVLNTPPSLIDSDQEFFIARVKSNGVNVIVQDKRNQRWRTKAQHFIDALNKKTNPLIGIESIKWDHVRETREKNLIYLSWGFRSTNYTVNTNLNILTLNGGEGGKYKSIANVQNDDFKGWRLYYKDGSYVNILDCVQTGSQVNLILDVLDINRFSSDGGNTFPTPLDEVFICPDAEAIEIFCSAAEDDSQSSSESVSVISELMNKKFVFPINTPVAKIKLLAYINDASDYFINYRYKHLKEYTEYFDIGNDTAFGYYTEKAFDSHGTMRQIVQANTYNQNLTDGYIKTYSNAIIELIINPNSYSLEISRIDLNDLLGLTHNTLSNSIPIVQLVVGSDRQHEVYEFTSLLTLTTDIFINLNKLNTDGNNCRNGNRFYLQFTAPVNLNSNLIRIVTDFVNPTDFTLLKQFTQADCDFFSQSPNGMFIIATFDGTDWVLSETNEVDILTVQTQWVDMPLVNLLGYNTNSLTLTQPISPIITTTFLSGLNSYLRYKQVGKTVHINFAFEINWNVANIINNFRLPLSIPINSIRQPSVNAYLLQHNSLNQFPSGVFEMYALIDAIYFRCESQADMRSSGANFGYHYTITGLIESPSGIEVARVSNQNGDNVLAVSSSAGSGNMKSVFSGQLTFELN